MERLEKQMKPVGKLLKNKNVRLSLVILLVVYTSSVIPQLSLVLNNFMDNKIIRFVVLGLSIYLVKKDILLSILLFTLLIMSSKTVREHWGGFRRITRGISSAARRAKKAAEAAARKAREEAEKKAKAVAEAARKAREEAEKRAREIAEAARKAAEAARKAAEAAIKKARDAANAAIQAAKDAAEEVKRAQEAVQSAIERAAAAALEAVTSKKKIGKAKDDVREAERILEEKRKILEQKKQALRDAESKALTLQNLAKQAENQIGKEREILSKKEKDAIIANDFADTKKAEASEVETNQTVGEGFSNSEFLKRYGGHEFAQV